jgi:hypothetical protein
MTQSEIQVKLKMAQDILSDVYQYACENDFGGLENQMSCADSCISDSLDMLSALSTEKSQ